MVLAILFVFLVHLFLGVPLFISLLLSSFVGFLFIDMGLAVRIMPQQFFSGIDSFALLAIPLFVLGGNLLNASGLTPKLMTFSKSLVGHYKGGLGYVNVTSSVFFAGVNGSAVADTTALGTILVPAMEKEGYSKGFAAGLTAGSSLIGPIIPPSIFMIIYSSLTNVSVGDLFLAGIIPGLILSVIFMLMNWVYAHKHDLKVNEEGFSIRNVLVTGYQALPALFAPLLIVFSIVFGIVTPTESGALIVIYSIIVGLTIGTLNWILLKKAIIESMKLTSAIFIIIAASSILTWVLGYAEVPKDFAKLLTPFIDNITLVLFILSAITFFVGMLMEEVSALVLLTPIFAPIALVAGVDPVHLGIIITMNITIALITPPMGACLYVASAVSKIPLMTMFREILPFIFFALIVLTIVILFPSIVLFLPEIFN